MPPPYLVFPPVRTLIGVQNIGHIDVALVAGTSYDTTMYPLSHLIDGTGKTAWRSNDPVVALRFDFGDAVAVSFVGVIGHNVDRDALFTVHATGSPASLVLPPFLPDDEFEVEWFADQVLNRAFSVRYPNCWVDVRNADGTPTVARYWQLHVNDNTRPVTISEVVIGLATEFDGIIAAPFAAQMEAQQTRDVLEYGQVYLSASGAVVRKLDLNLTLMQEQVALMHELYDYTHGLNARMVVVPDSHYNDIWLVEWPSLRETTFGESYLVGTHRLALVEEMFGVV